MKAHKVWKSGENTGIQKQFKVHFDYESTICILQAIKREVLNVKSQNWLWDHILRYADFWSHTLIESSDNWYLLKLWVTYFCQLYRSLYSFCLLSLNNWFCHIYKFRSDFVLLIEFHFAHLYMGPTLIHMGTCRLICNADTYSTRHVKMDSASRVSLEANLAGNASRGKSRVSLDNKLWVEYSHASGTKYHQQSSKCLANFMRQIVDREWCPAVFEGLTLRTLRTFFVQFHVSKMERS